LNIRFLNLTIDMNLFKQPVQYVQNWSYSIGIDKSLW